MERDGRHEIGRRRLLAGAGAAAALTLGVRATSTRTGAATAAAPQDDGGTEAPRLALERIQGNVVGGFHQHHQVLILLVTPDEGAARRWLRGVAPHVTSAEEVVAAHEAFAADPSDPPDLAPWVNVALTFEGLRRLGRSDDELSGLPRAFRAGMAARARRIGDTGASAPDAWPEPYRRRADAVVIVASDDEADLAEEVVRQVALVDAAGGEVLRVERGDAREDEPGHEHFGFRDGISQPGLRGVTDPANPDDPGQGLPGQDLLWPGEFVLGQPRQAGVGGGDAPGPLSDGGPAWTADGSFLVLRRLRQDVPGFHAFLADVARTQGISEDLAGAKVVGRYRSGAPLEVTGAQATDPVASDPAVCDDDRINDFEFEDDLDGTRVPLAAHIRKTYPRDQPTDDGGEEDTQTHRLLRRGIPFGPSYVEGSSASDAAFPRDRGLLFLAYQWSIERQFEHVQRRWVNDPDFPEDDSGQDPVIAQSPATGSFSLPGGRPDHVALMSRFVTTTGGDYFLQPSLPALAELGGEPAAPPPSTTPEPPPATAPDDAGGTGPDRRPPTARGGRRRPRRAGPAAT